MVRAQRPGLLRVLGLDAPGSVLPGDERPAIGLPAELARYWVPRDDTVIRDLGRG